MVVVPPPREIGLLYGLFVLNLPDDVYILLNRWGSNFTTHNDSYYNSSGRKAMGPWYSIAYLVTKQVCTKRVLAYGLPSEDNIKVGVELTVLFEVIDPYRFVYNIGVLRFDSLLDASIDDSVRSLIRKTPHYRLFDLTSKFADSMKQQLNKRV